MVNLSLINSRSKPATDTLRILVVDDQKFVQYKLQQMLSTEANFQIVGTASDGEMAIAQVEALKPDVILIDIEMPKMNGIEATKIISQRFPNCKILIFSSHEDREYVQKIIAAGADGYILKSTPTEDLITAIYSVCKGYSHFGSQLIKKIQLTQDVDRAPKNHSKSIASADSITAERSQISHGLKLRSTDESSPPVSRWLTRGGISVVTMIILAIPATAILKYKTVVRARAIVRPAEELDLVQAAVDGQVSQILVKEGQAVKRGQAIATIDLARFKTQQNQLKKGIEQQKLQLGQLNSQIASLSSQIIAETERNQSEIAAAKSELESVRRNYQDKNSEVTTQVEESRANVKAVEATLNAAKAKYNRYKSVAEAGAIGKDQLSEAELAVRQQEQELEAAEAKLKRAIAALNPTTAEIDMSQRRIEQVERSGRATIAGLNREREALIGQRIEINQQLEQDTEELNRVDWEQANSKITATATGTIFELNLRNPNQTVQFGQEIARILPENSKLEIKAAVSPQDITELEVGQEVQMQVSTCPYPDYGTFGGTVTRIAEDTNKLPSQQENTQAKANNTFYEVIIAPDSNTFGREEHQCSLQLGMESQTDIISREETVLQHILKKARLTANL